MSCQPNALAFGRAILRVLAAELVSCVTLAVYIELTRDLPFTTTPDGLDSDMPVLFACVGMCAVSVLALPCKWLYRVPMAIASIPFFFYLLAYFWLGYEMTRTGGCL